LNIINSTHNKKDPALRDIYGIKKKYSSCSISIDLPAHTGVSIFLVNLFENKEKAQAFPL